MGIYCLKIEVQWVWDWIQAWIETKTSWKVMIQNSVLVLVPSIWNSGDKSAWPPAASVTGAHILPYLSWTKTSCVARESFLNPRIDKNVTAAYPIGFSTESSCVHKQPSDDVLEKPDWKVSFVKRGRCDYHQGNGVGGDWNSCTDLFLSSLPTVSTLLVEESQCLRKLDNNEDNMEKHPDL